MTGAELQAAQDVLSLKAFEAVLEEAASQALAGAMWVPQSLAWSRG